MIDNVILFVIVMGYLIAGNYPSKFILKRLASTNPYLKLLVLSFCYAMIFGIGILGSNGGDPGFAFPFPIILAALIYIWEWPEVKFFITGVVFPLGFWWTLIFIVMLMKDAIKRRRNKINLLVNETTNE